MLARQFIDRFCREQNKKSMAISTSAVEEMQAYPWPGNVRELQNCVERAVILTVGDTIHARHLNLTTPAGQPAAPAAEEERDMWDAIDMSGTLAEVTRRVVARVEKRKIEQTLKAVGSDRSRTAEMLQVSFKALLAKCRDYGIE